MRWWVISHPVRGILKSDSEPSLSIWRFQWSKPMGHEGNWKFSSDREARLVISRMPQKMQEQCTVEEVRG